MMKLSRRDFLKAAAISAPLCFGWDLKAGVAPKALRFGICADPHQDIMHDAETRLRRFIEDANHRHLDFIIQLGDFCCPFEKNRSFLEIWEEFSGPRYHTLGNHDSDGGFTWEQVLAYWTMPQRYYSLDQAGWHFVVLDCNEIKPGKRAPGYPRYVGEEQRAWLRQDLKRTQAPTMVFSHQGLGEQGVVENREEVRAILEAANREAGWRKVGACFNGHDHIDFANETAGIHYVEINSMSYLWLGEQFPFVRYGAEVDKAYPSIKYTAPYRDALFATVELSPEGGLKITGRRSEFVGPSPWELGIQEAKGTARDKLKMVPWISDRELRVQARN